MKLDIVELGADDAQLFIEVCIEGNRNPSRSTMSQYVTDMLEGRWYLSGDTIKFDTDGNLIDGYQRMLSLKEACRIRPGFTVQFAIAEDVDKNAYPVIDNGRKRTSANAVHMATKGEYSGQSMSIVRAHWQYVNGNPIGATGAVAIIPTRAQEIAHWNADRDGFEAAIKRGKDAWKQNLGTPRPTGVMYHVLSNTEGVADDTKHDFFDKFLSGANLPPESPILSLRSRLQRRGRKALSRNEAQPYTYGEQLYLMHRTWQAYCLDEPVKIALPKTRITNGNFPKLFVPANL